jgi:glyoxylase-like metal-dependent hydrolase (beta-lactamase superfamily II)
MTPSVAFRRWTAGAITVTRIVELESIGGTRFILPQADREAALALPWLQPHHADAEGRLIMTIHSLVIETPLRRILVDTGLGNDKTGRSVPRWNGLATPYLAMLAEAGYPAESIDTVLCTHLHVDHVGWNTRLLDGRWVPTFPQARYLFGRTEYDHWKTHRDDAAHPPAHIDDSVLPVMAAGRADLFNADTAIADEITVISTPGHSPGHFSFLLQSGGDSLLLAGDAAHHPIQLAHPDWCSTADHDRAGAIRSRLMLAERFAGTETQVIGGHFSGGRIRRDGAAFRLDGGPG